MLSPLMIKLLTGAGLVGLYYFSKPTANVPAPGPDPGPGPLPIPRPGPVVNPNQDVPEPEPNVPIIDQPGVAGVYFGPPRIRRTRTGWPWY
jgi:hypothetical protein